MPDHHHPAFERLIKHLPEDFDVMLVTLKGHLLLEEQLNDYIDRAFPHPEALKGLQLGFNVKVRLAHAMSRGWPQSVWDALATLNKIRNSLAHKIEDANVRVLMQQFVTQSRQAGWDPGDDEEDLEGEYVLCIAFFVGMLAPAIEE